MAASASVTTRLELSINWAPISYVRTGSRSDSKRLAVIETIGVTGRVGGENCAVQALVRLCILRAELGRRAAQEG